jgi:hypothetical protein
MRDFALLLLLSLLAGCAESGQFPSLAQRPIERELPPPDVDPKVAPVADDPAIAARIAAFLAQAHQSQAEFEATLPAAEAAARRAGAPESESWILAQEALSSAEAAQDSTARLLSDLDAYSLDIAREKAISDADAESLQAAVAEIQRIADSDRERLARLEARLRTP